MKQKTFIYVVDIIDCSISQSKCVSNICESGGKGKAGKEGKERTYVFAWRKRYPPWDSNPHLLLSGQMS